MEHIAKTSTSLLFYYA